LREWRRSLISDSNPGRYLVVVSLAAPSVVAILERVPVSLGLIDDVARWAFDLRLLSLTRLPAGDVVARTGAALARGRLEGDAQVLVDSTSAGSLSVRSSRVLGGGVFRVISGAIADEDKRFEDVHCVTAVDVADAVRVTRERLTLTPGIPLIVVARLTSQARAVEFALPERPVALAMWHAHRYGGCEFPSRRPTPAQLSAQTVRQIDVDYNRGLEQRKREEREERAFFGTD
jgi:hypothetical protein